MFIFSSPLLAFSIEVRTPPSGPLKLKVRTKINVANSCYWLLAILVKTVSPSLLGQL